MEQVKVFEPIHIEVPRESILRRLGFRAGKTFVTQVKKQQIDRAIDGARALITLKGVARRVAIKKKNDSIIVLESGIVFKSKNLFAFLKESNEIMLIAATVGKKITDAISKKSTGKDVETAVIWDALASEMADGSLNWIQQYCNRFLWRENKQLTRNRYSCGYGDFLLENQNLPLH